MKTEKVYTLLDYLGFKLNKKEKLVTYSSKSGKVSVVLLESGSIHVISNVYAITIIINEHNLIDDHVKSAVRMLESWLEIG